MALACVSFEFGFLFFFTFVRIGGVVGGDRCFCFLNSRMVKLFHKNCVLLKARPLSSWALGALPVTDFISSPLHLQASHLSLS